MLGGAANHDFWPRARERQRDTWRVGVAAWLCRSDVGLQLQHKRFARSNLSGAANHRVLDSLFGRSQDMLPFLPAKAILVTSASIQQVHHELRPDAVRVV